MTAPEPTALLSAPSVERLQVKIFADGANLEGMLALYRDDRIAGFTTNPTLMRGAGIADYRAFAHEVLAAIPDRSISFEVFSDELDEMERQAREIASWGEDVYVKIPVATTRRESTAPLGVTSSTGCVQLAQPAAPCKGATGQLGKCKSGCGLRPELTVIRRRRV